MKTRNTMAGDWIRDFILGMASTFAPIPRRNHLGTLEDDWRVVGDDLRKAMAEIDDLEHSSRRNGHL